MIELMFNLTQEKFFRYSSEWKPWTPHLICKHIWSWQIQRKHHCDYFGLWTWIEWVATFIHHYSGMETRCNSLNSKRYLTNKTQLEWWSCEALFSHSKKVVGLRLRHFLCRVCMFFLCCFTSGISDFFHIPKKSCVLWPKWVLKESVLH